MKKKVLILGGGLAGIEAAIKLRGKQFEIELVSNREYLFVYPISIWVPVRKINFENVCIPLSELSKKHNFKLTIDEVKQINPSSNEVELAMSKIPYDYLIIAIGMSKFPIKGIENTLSICGNPVESIKIADKLDNLIVGGSGNIAVGFGGNPNDASATAVRGGPAFELLFNISHYLKKRKIRSNFTISFFAPMSDPGKKMGDNAPEKIMAFMERYGIESYTGKKIIEFKPNKILFENGTNITSDLTVFIQGGSGNSIIIESVLPVNEAGFIKIDETCLVEGHTKIYAIGDSAALSGPKWAAKQGHLAEVMANVAANNIINQEKKLIKRFSYINQINILCVMDTGDGAAIVYRNNTRNFIIPLPVIGHWLKKSWGFYYKNSKLRRIPRLPGM